MHLFKKPQWTFSPVPRTLKGLVAVHLRRGDYIGHCKWLAYLQSEYNGWNAFPSYIDQFDAEERKNEDLFMRKCLPTPTQIIERLRVVKEEYEAAHGEGHELTRVYVLNNAEELFRMDLEKGLKDDGWEAVHMTLDLDVEKGEKEVDMAADMMIAQLAEVFVGNGVSRLGESSLMIVIDVLTKAADASLYERRQWSSLTSNINLVRMVSGVSTDSIRFL